MQLKRGKDGKVKMVAVDYEDQYFGVSYLQNILLIALIPLIVSIISVYYPYFNVILFFVLFLIWGFILALFTGFEVILIEKKEKGDCDSRTSEED